MKVINDNNFEEAVVKNDKPVVVDFFTTWCPPCKMLAPVIEKLSEEYAGKVDFVKMDLDQCPKTGSDFGVDRIPTVFFMKGGEPTSFFVGFRSEEEIKEWIENELGNK
jgi:thioredoxin 1